MGALAFVAHFSLASTPVRSEQGVFGGPVAEQLPAVQAGAVDDLALLASTPRIVDRLDLSRHVEEKPYTHLAFLSQGLLMPPTEPALPGGGAIVNYSVERGDTLSSIAKEFGMSVETILQSNPSIKSRSLQIGQTLVILPVSGGLHTVLGGETPGSIARKYGVNESDLAMWNRGTDLANLVPGTKLAVPGMGGSPLSANTKPDSSSPSLPALKNYFAMPTTGFNWGRLHHYNAVDIANTCGTSILAAAEGLVTDLSHDTWSQGYGKYVVLEHPNGTKTKYAHLKTIAVEIGDFVKQGDKLGTMGETGEATGCHLHFEVTGAKNPFARQ